MTDNLWRIGQWMSSVVPWASSMAVPLLHTAVVAVVTSMALFAGRWYFDGQGGNCPRCKRRSWQLNETINAPSIEDDMGTFNGPAYGSESDALCSRRQGRLAHWSSPVPPLHDQTKDDSEPNRPPRKRRSDRREATGKRQQRRLRCNPQAGSRRLHDAPAAEDVTRRNVIDSIGDSTTRSRTDSATPSPPPPLLPLADISPSISIHRPSWDLFRLKESWTPRCRSPTGTDDDKGRIGVQDGRHESSTSPIRPDPSSVKQAATPSVAAAQILQRQEPAQPTSKESPERDSLPPPCDNDADDGSIQSHHGSRHRPPSHSADERMAGSASRVADDKFAPNWDADAHPKRQQQSQQCSRDALNVREAKDHRAGTVGKILSDEGIESDDDRVDEDAGQDRDSAIECGGCDTDQQNTHGDRSHGTKGDVAIGNLIALIRFDPNNESLHGTSLADIHDEASAVTLQEHDDDEEIYISQREHDLLKAISSARDSRELATAQANLTDKLRAIIARACRTDNGILFIQEA
jgi:hypothetical protein